MPLFAINPDFANVPWEYSAEDMDLKSDGDQSIDSASVRFFKFFVHRIFHNSLDSVIASENNIVFYANNAFRTFFDLNNGQVIGTKLCAVLDRVTVCNGEKGRMFRMRQFKTDQSEMSNLEIIMFIDDTPWRDAQRATEVLVEQLLRADRQAALGEMAMALAHEINQPLGAIVNFAGAARHTLKGRAIRAHELDEVLQNIGAEAARAGDVIKSLRSFLRGKPTAASFADVNAAVKAVIGFSEPAMREQSISLKLGLAANLPKLQADQIILQQIVLNLVSNAIQAVDGQPLSRRKLEISTFIDNDNMVAISVRDTGIGLPQDLGEQIFEPFVTTKENGSGLGLSIARTLAQRLGGTIEGQTEVRKGACFTIRLPCRSIEEL